MEWSGVVLAGGESRRMGESKAELPLGGKTLLEWAIEGLQRAGMAEVIVAWAAEREAPKVAEGVKLVRDQRVNEGPVRGLEAGFEAATGEVVFVTTCDAPLLAAGFPAMLREQMGDGAAAAPWIEGKIHPLTAVYRREPALAAARRLLERGERRATELVRELGGKLVGPEAWAEVDPTGRSLWNLNTRAEYEAAVEVFRQGEE